MTITSQDREKAIWNKWERGECLHTSSPLTVCTECIAAALAEVREEGRKSEYAKARELLDKYIDKAYAEGYAKAVEDAAKVCDFHSNDDECDNCSKEIAKAIRGLKGTK